MKCSICSLIFKGRKGLSKHLFQKHKLVKKQLIEYYAETDNRLKAERNKARAENKKQFIQCKICENYYASLSGHLTTHNISSTEYKIKYGVLVSEETSHKNSVGRKKYWNMLLETKKKALGSRIAAVRKEHGTNNGGRKAGFKHSSEWKEKHRQWMFANNPFRGKKHSRKTRDLMSQNHADFSGENNPFKRKYEADLDFKISFKNTHKELWKRRSEAWRRQLREKQSKVHAYSKNLPCIKNSKKGYKRGYYLSNKIPSSFAFRSSWEIHAAYCFDIYDKINYYEYEKVVIPYWSNDHYRHLIPDFLIHFTNKERLLIEVKPKALVKVFNYKILEHECWCLENNTQYMVLTEDFLFNAKLFDLLDRAYEGGFYVDKIIRQGFKSTLHFMETMWGSKESN